MLRVMKRDRVARHREATRRDRRRVKEEETRRALEETPPSKEAPICLDHRPVTNVSLTAFERSLAKIDKEFRDKQRSRRDNPTCHPRFPDKQEIARRIRQRIDSKKTQLLPAGSTRDLLLGLSAACLRSIIARCHGVDLSFDDAKLLISLLHGDCDEIKRQVNFDQCGRGADCGTNSASKGDNRGNAAKTERQRSSARCHECHSPHCPSDCVTEPWNFDEIPHARAHAARTARTSSARTRSPHDATGEQSAPLDSGAVGNAPTTPGGIEDVDTDQDNSSQNEHNGDIAAIPPLQGDHGPPLPGVRRPIVEAVGEGTSGSGVEESKEEVLMSDNEGNDEETKPVSAVDRARQEEQRLENTMMAALRHTLEETAFQACRDITGRNPSPAELERQVNESHSSLRSEFQMLPSTLPSQDDLPHSSADISWERTVPTPGHSRERTRVKSQDSQQSQPSPIESDDTKDGDDDDQESQNPDDFEDDSPQTPSEDHSDDESSTDEDVPDLMERDHDTSSDSDAGDSSSDSSDSSDDDNEDDDEKHDAHVRPLFPSFSGQPKLPASEAKKPAPPTPQRRLPVPKTHIPPSPSRRKKKSAQNHSANKIFGELSKNAHRFDLPTLMNHSDPLRRRNGFIHFMDKLRSALNLTNETSECLRNLVDWRSPRASNANQALHWLPQANVDKNVKNILSELIEELKIDDGFAALQVLQNLCAPQDADNRHEATQAFKLASIQEGESIQ